MILLLMIRLTKTSTTMTMVTLMLLTKSYECSENDFLPPSWNKDALQKNYSSIYIELPGLYRVY